MERILHILYKPTDFPLKFFANFTNLGMKMRSIPFRLNPTTSQFEPFKTKGDVWIWRLLITYAISYCTFICTDFFLQCSMYLEEKRFLELLMAMVWCVCGFVILSDHFHYLFRHEEIVEALNSVLSLRDIIHVRSASETYRTVWNKIDLLAFILQGNATISTILQCLIFWFFPTHRRYPYAFFPKTWQNIWVKTLMVIIEGFVHAMTAWNGFVTGCIINILYIDTYRTTLILIRSASPAKTLEYYRILRVIEKIHYSGFGTIGLPTLQLVVSIGVLGTLSAAIKLGNKVDPMIVLFLYLLCFSGVVFLAILLPMAGKIYQNSIDCIDEVKARVGLKNKELNARVKCCPPIGISMASIYLIRRGTTLTFMAIMLTNLVNILVALGEYE